MIEVYSRVYVQLEAMAGIRECRLHCTCIYHSAGAASIRDRRLIETRVERTASMREYSPKSSRECVIIARELPCYNRAETCSFPARSKTKGS
jgi:hypothetical protein